MNDDTTTLRAALARFDFTDGLERGLLARRVDVEIRIAIVERAHLDPGQVLDRAQERRAGARMPRIRMREDDGDHRTAPSRDRHGKVSARMPAKTAAPTLLLWRKARKHPSRVRSRIIG